MESLWFFFFLQENSLIKMQVKESLGHSGGQKA